MDQIKEAFELGFKNELEQDNLEKEAGFFKNLGSKFMRTFDKPTRDLAVEKGPQYLEGIADIVEASGKSGFGSTAASSGSSMMPFLTGGAIGAGSMYVGDKIMGSGGRPGPALQRQRQRQHQQYY